MNALSVQCARTRRQVASRPRTVLPAVATLAALLSLPGLARAAATDQPIVASLNPPPAGLACDAAAAATSVYFQFAKPPFQVSQLSLYLDGKGVPQDAVDEHWPTVTLSKGLHPGSNTVDIVANGASGQHIERRMIVQVGGAASGSTAQVACDEAAATQAQPQVADPAAAVVEAAPAVIDEVPEPVVVQDTPPVVYEAPPQVVYAYPPPVYIYNPYPLVAFDPWVPFVPFFSFGFFYSNYHPWCPPPRVVDGGYYGHGGWYGGGWHGNPGPGWRGGNGGGWNGGNGGWRGGNGGSGVGRYPQPLAPNGGAGAAPVSGWHGAPQRSGPQPFYSGNAGNNGGWHGQPMPQNRGGWQNAPRPVQQPPAQYRATFAPPAQQYRPPMPQQAFHPSAPAPVFRGGGGGGGWHGAPAGGHGGGFSHR